MCSSSFGAADRSRYEIVGTKGSVVCDPAFEYAEGLSYELTVGEKKKRKKFARSDQFAPELVHFAKSVRATVNSCFLNSGQTCNALTRMLVPRGRAEEAARLAAESAERFTVGDPFA